MLHPPGFYFVKKPKRLVILSSDKSSERNLSCFFDIIKPRRMEHLQREEPFSSDPYFNEISTYRDTLPSNNSDLLPNAFENTLQVSKQVVYGSFRIDFNPFWIGKKLMIIS